MRVLRWRMSSDFRIQNGGSDDRSRRRRRGERGWPGLAHLRRADPVLARVIDAHADFDARGWLRDLPPMDAFGALIFMVTGQQLSVRSATRILGRLADLFGGELPSPAQLLGLDPADLLTAGFSRRKAQTLRTVAAKFADGTLSEERLRRLSDEEILDQLTAISGVGPWTVQGFLILALDRPTWCTGRPCAPQGDQGRLRA